MKTGRNRWGLAAASFILGLGFDAAAEPPSTTFTGEVTRGAAFERDLGGGLRFRLRPLGAGWMIWIGDAARPSRNFATVATPPYRGVNALHIAGWHFRNSDNTGANQAGPKNVNAPGRVRRFQFVVDLAAHNRAQVALRTLLWPIGRPASEIETAEKAIDGEKKRNGVLDIRAMELGNLDTGARAWIERLEFTVTIR